MTTPFVVNGAAGAAALPIGEILGYSDWIDITQDRIKLFTDSTGDHQWLHVDADAAARGSYGRTIAHGYLTLSLVCRSSSRRS